MRVKLLFVHATFGNPDTYLADTCHIVHLPTKLTLGPGTSAPLNIDVHTKFSIRWSHDQDLTALASRTYARPIKDFTIKFSTTAIYMYCIVV